MQTQQLDTAWDIIREARGLNIRLVAEHGRLFYRTREAIPLEFHRRLQVHKPAILLILDALATSIPPDGAPGVHEACRYCAAHMWMRFAGAWQCGKCHGLWRPLRTQTSEASA